MAINAVRAIGDDQTWKREVEAVIEQMRTQIAVLQQQIVTLERRVN